MRDAPQADPARIVDIQARADRADEDVRELAVWTDVRYLLAEVARLHAENTELKAQATKTLLREGTDEASPISVATALTDPKGCEQ